METLAALVYQLGSDYITFIPMVNKVRTGARLGGGGERAAAAASSRPRAARSS